MTTLVNIRKGKHKCDVYIGRGTPFGNPHVIGYCLICRRVHDREDSVKEYRIYFNRRLTDQTFRDRVLSLKDKVLGCWCVPLLCHGMVIVEFLETNEN
jgi:hypothetical protein